MPSKKSKVKIEVLKKSSPTPIIDFSGTDDLLEALNETVVAAVAAKAAIENLNQRINSLNEVKVQYKLVKNG